MGSCLPTLGIRSYYSRQCVHRDWRTEFTEVILLVTAVTGRKEEETATEGHPHGHGGPVTALRDRIIVTVSMQADLDLYGGSANKK